jgi:hypothetical protein
MGRIPASSWIILKGGGRMMRRRYTVEYMIGLLLEMDVKLSQSKNIEIKEMLANNLLVVYTSAVKNGRRKKS